MIRNSIFISLDSFLGGTGGTGGTPQELARTGGTDRWDQCAQGCPRGSAIFHGGPTGPTVRYHQKSAKLPAVPPVPPVPPGITAVLSWDAKACSGNPRASVARQHRIRR